MAVEGYTPLDLAGCLDTPKILSSFESLQAMVDAAQEDSYDIGCRRVDAILEGKTRLPTESCITIVEGAGRLTGRRQKCIFMLTYRSFFDFPGGVVTGETTVDVKIKCGGNTVAAFQSNESSDTGIGSVVLVAECDTGESIEICATGTFVETVNQGNILNGLDWTFAVCGGIVCIAEISIAQNCWIPCAIEPECRFGMEAIYLMIDVVNKLCDAYGGRSRSIECLEFKDVEYTSDTPIFAAANVPTDTVWLAFGAMKVCLNNFGAPNTGGETRYEITPQIGCQSDPEPCLTTILRAPESNDLPSYSFLRNRCFLLPSLLCGNCPANESLIIGFNDDLTCDQIAEDAPTSNQVTVTGDWCLWLFRRNDSEFTTRLKSPGKCLSYQGDLLPIEQKLEQVHEVACDRQPINCYAEKEIINGQSDDVFQLVPPSALPNPPPNPLPVPWPPVKKYALYGDLQFCLDPTGTNLEEETWVRVNYIIRCGGTIIDQGPSTPWLYINSGFANECVSLNVAVACATCEIDQPITIEFEYAQILGPAQTLLPGPVTGCISVTSFG